MTRLIKGWLEITSSHGTCFYEFSCVRGWGGTTLILLHWSAMHCFMLLFLWASAVFGRRPLQDGNLCRAGPVSAARGHFEYSLLFVNRLNCHPLHANMFLTNSLDNNVHYTFNFSFSIRAANG